jgi:hypothetical protein
MGHVRRVMVYMALWGGATALAMLLVWFGARPVLHNAVFGPPPALPVVRGPLESSGPPADPVPSPPLAMRSASPSPTPSPSPRRPSSPPPPVENHTYALVGGRVVLAVTPASARLISATPNPGYEVRTWHSAGWLRVDFTNGQRTSSLFVTWNGHEPAVQVVNYTGDQNG